MANIGISTIKLVDSDGDPLDNGAGELQVVLNASSAVNIGDVDLEFNGTAASVGAGSQDTGTLRVTLASDDALGALIEAHTLSAKDSLDEIESAIEVLELTVGTDGSTGPSKCMSIGGTVALGGAIQEIAVDTDGHLQIDIIGGPNYITSLVSDRDEDVGTTAEKIHTAADVAIKRIDIQASPDNTGYIYVGDSGVAGDGSGGGIRLAAGDFYSLDIDNTADVYVAASVDQEDVYYTYFT